MASEFSVGGVDVSRETKQKLEELVVLISKWTKSINLVASKSIPEIWVRHIVDSAQVYHVAPKVWSNWADLGSGGGLPALVVSILDPKHQPMTLIESDKRKCLFLNTARRELGLNITILNDRIENVDSSGFDVISARALAPLPALLTYAEHMLMDGGVALFSKGSRFQEELDLAKESWHFDVTGHTSQTNADSRILEISRIRRREC